jgi:hypothetical protein
MLHVEKCHCLELIGMLVISVQCRVFMCDTDVGHRLLEMNHCSDSRAA